MARRLQNEGRIDPERCSVPSVASEPNIVHHHHHHSHGPRGRGDRAEANESASPFALLVEGAEANPPSPNDRGERTPASRTAPAQAERADAQASEQAKEPAADAAPAPAAEAKAASKAPGNAAAPEADEDTADELEAAVAAAAVGDTNAAPPTPAPPAAPVAVPVVPAQQQGGNAEGGDGTTAAAIGTSVPQIPIAGPQGPEPPEGGPDEAAAADTEPAGAQPPPADDGRAAKGKDAAVVERGNERTLPLGSRPVGEPAAEIERAAATAPRGKAQAKAEPKPARADQPAAGEPIGDEPVADEVAAAGARSTAAPPEAAPGENQHTAAAQHRPHHQADLQTADDTTRQPPGAQVSETAHGAKPPSETLLAILPASDAAHGAAAQTGQAAPAAAQPGSDAAVPIAGLAVEIAARAQAGRNRFEIRLDPPELGRIDVRLDVDRNGQVTSRLVVDRAETLEYLRRDAADLERALQQAGLKTTDNGLQFTLRDQGFAGRDDHASPYSARLIVPSSGTAAADVQQSAYSAVWRAGGIDIRV